MKKNISYLLIIFIIIITPRIHNAQEYKMNNASVDKFNVIGFDRLTKSKVDINISNSLHSKILRDLKNPVEEEHLRISSQFGYRINPFLNSAESVSSNKKILNHTLFHTGLDISSSNINGSNIYSVLDGTIKKITENDLGYGNFITIEHGGFETLYAHMSEIRMDLKEGSFIMSGEKIGKVGSTGRSTGPHLHIEFNFGTISLDPELFLTIK